MKEHLVDASRGYSGSRRLCFSCYGPQSSVMSHGYPQSRESVRCSFHEQHKRIIIINHQSSIINRDKKSGTKTEAEDETIGGTTRTVRCG